MKDTVSISVLMAVYNTSQEYLTSAIMSIITQSFSDLEFIIIDDGSNDLTSSYLMKFAETDRRIVLHKIDKNIGLTRALNEGLKLVRGEFIARQDADDVSGFNRLKAQLEFLNSHPEIDAVCAGVEMIDASGKIIGKLKVNSSKEKLYRNNSLVHGSMLFRRRVFDRLGSYDERLIFSQDYGIYLKMLRMYGMQIGVLTDSHYFLRKHSDSLSSRHVIKQFYYSAKAKSFSKSHKYSYQEYIDFYKNLIFDFIFIHRLFFGFLLRKLKE